MTSSCSLNCSIIYSDTLPTTNPFHAPLQEQQIGISQLSVICIFYVATPNGIQWTIAWQRLFRFDRFHVNVYWFWHLILLVIRCLWCSSYSDKTVNIKYLSTLQPRQNGRHFEDDIFTSVFLYEQFCVLIKILLKWSHWKPFLPYPHCLINKHIYNSGTFLFDFLSQIRCCPYPEKTPDMSNDRVSALLDRYT